MGYDSQKHHRRSIRLPNYNYSGMGAYFVTICTHEKECLFGDIINMEIRLNDFGNVVAECWRSIPAHFENVELEVFVIMPNHVHGIIMITDTTTLVGATHASPLRCSCSTPPKGSKPQSIGALIGSFKSEVSKRIHEISTTPNKTVWQRNYYEHVIRNETEWGQIRQYIESNPARWPEDSENPTNMMK